jgi:hypothetical protein
MTCLWRYAAFAHLPRRAYTGIMHSKDDSQYVLGRREAKMSGGCFQNVWEAYVAGLLDSKYMYVAGDRGRCSHMF